MDPAIRVVVDVGGKSHRVDIADPDEKLLEEFVIPPTQERFQDPLRSGGTTSKV